MNPPYRRAVLGIALAIGMLGALPVAVSAAQPSCGDTLTVNTTLTANLDCSGYGGTALYMGADDIVLNLNGKTITGPTGADGNYGVDTDEYNRTTIRNGKINNYYIGVYVNESRRTLVQNIQMIGENIASTYGVYVDYGVKNTLNLLNISGVETAVYHEYGGQLKVTNSTLVGHPTNGEGVYLYQTTADTVSGNTLMAEYGAYENQSHRSTYIGNTANGGNYGFYFECDGYGQVTATGNTANNNDSTGFYVDECYVVDHPVDGFIGSRIVGNTANGNSYGFEGYDSYNELWRMNVANDNDNDGFYFDYPSNYRIVYNTALRNGSSGFYIDDNYSYYNVEKVSFNTARRNDSYGFYAGYGAPGDDNVARFNSPNCYNVDC